MTDQHGESPIEPAGESSTPPEAAATPPPAPAPASPPPSATGPAGTGHRFDADQVKGAFQGADRFDLGIIAAGVIAFLATFMPFYTASVGNAAFHVSANASAWHGFFGWFGALCCLAGAVVATLALLDVALPLPVGLTVLGAFALGALCLILALFVFPGGGCGGMPGCDTGHGFGYWLALLAGVVGTGLAYVRTKDTLLKTA